MQDTIPTVKVDDGKGGFYIINECDFDPKEHVKHGEKPKRTRKTKSAE